MSVDACATMVAQADPDRFASAMCAPLPARGDLMVLYAFNIEVARAPWVTQEPMIAEMRLQWWKDAIDEIYSDAKPRRHEVVTALADLVQRAGLPRRLFDDLIEARRFDIYKEPHTSRAAFDAYVAATSGNVMELAGRALGAENLVPFQRMGWAMGAANLLRALPSLFQSGRNPVPVIDADMNGLIEGRLDARMSTEIEQIARDGLTALDQARQFRSVPKPLHPALLAGWQAKQVLSKINANPQAVYDFVDTEDMGWKRSFILTAKTVLGRW